MEYIDATTVARRSIQGVLSLTLRSSFIQIVNTVSLFVLAAYLSQSAFGVFYIVSAVLSFAHADGLGKRRVAPIRGGHAKTQASRADARAAGVCRPRCARRPPAVSAIGR